MDAGCSAWRPGRHGHLSFFGAVPSSMSISLVWKRSKVSAGFRARRQRSVLTEKLDISLVRPLKHSRTWVARGLAVWGDRLHALAPFGYVESGFVVGRRGASESSAQTGRPSTTDNSA